MAHIDLHVHSDGSNTRGFLDSTNRIEDLIAYTHKLGKKGMALTDHDTITMHMKALHHLRDLKKKDPDEWKDYKLILGNEIYLCGRKAIEEEKHYKFYHFILLAKDYEGHRQIQELSTRAWTTNGFFYVNIRTPTFYDDLFEVVEANRGHLVGCTACLGGQLPEYILQAYRENPDKPDYIKAKKWLTRMYRCFGEGNFFLEMQPSNQEDQIIVNKAILELSAEMGIPYVITTDAHYLKKEDRPVHEAFLNSNEDSGKDREVGEFYATTYIMDEAEIHSYMDESLGHDAVQKGIDNTELVLVMCEEYSLDQKLEIPYEPTGDTEPDEKLIKKYCPVGSLMELFSRSDHQCNRHMMKLILEKIENNQDELNNQQTFDAIENCLNTMKIISDKQDTQWSAYLLQVKDLVDACWEAGSLVGPSRGSGLGFILLYLLDITQVNPLREEVETYPWRFLNPERVSVPDVDIDFINVKRESVIQILQHKYCGDNVDAGNRRVMRVQTLLTMKSKNAIVTACRGLGYTPEEAQMLSAHIGAERGLQFTLKQTYYGDEDNNLPPDKEFRNLMDGQYKDVWEVAQNIEGLVSGVGSHAGGVILTPKDITNYCALMRTSAGDIITQYDLHQAENAGLIKFDLLSIDALGKIQICLQLLLDDGLIEWQGDWRSTYEKYVGVYKIERDNPEIWDMINNHKITSLFQMEKQSGFQAIKVGKPRSLADMSALNSVMRLMAPEPGAESPLERYGRYRDNINLWYDEMTHYGLTDHEQEVVRKYAEKSYGLLPNQEDFMSIVQDPEIGGLGLLWSDRLRKSIAKKNPKEYLQLQQEFYANIKEKNLSPKLCHYVWDVLIAMNRGYGFNTAHTLAYSIVGLQEANLAYHYPIIYWNCANLISDSGGEDGNVNYGKIASAIGNIQKEGVKVVLPSVNRVRFGFHPDAKKNEIVYGLKGISGIGTKVAKAIIDNQPYSSMWDFYDKMQAFKNEDKENKFGDTAMITLIKAGAFDEIENRPRTEIMADFIRFISSPISALKMANIVDLNELGLLTPEQKKYELRLFNFRKYLYQEKFLVKQTGKSPATAYYRLDRKFAEPFFYENFESDMTEGKHYEFDEDGFIIVKRGALDKVYEKLTADFKQNVLGDETILAKVNEARFENVWREKVPGTISRWEMESMNFYYTEHELAHVNAKLYNIENFFDHSPEAEISGTYMYHGIEKPRFKLWRIAGTVIDRDKNKNTVTLLTTDGVVMVKFYKGQFNFYDKQIVEVAEDGTKTVIEKSWFQRGNLLLVTGYRREEQFVPRKYVDSVFKHSLQLITGIRDDGSLILQSERAGQEDV